MQVAKPKKGYKLVKGDFKQKFEIPEQWELNPLESLVKKIRSGGTPKTSEKSFYGGGIPFVTIQDITLAQKYIETTIKTLSEEGVKNSSAWKIPKNYKKPKIVAAIQPQTETKRVFNIPTK